MINQAGYGPLICGINYYFLTDLKKLHFALHKTIITYSKKSMHDDKISFPLESRYKSTVNFIGLIILVCVLKRI